MSGTARGEPAAAGRVPDPGIFIAEAERATNQRDLEAIMRAYAADATLEVITNGALERHCRHAELRAAWIRYLDGMRRGRFTLRKRLVCAAPSTITSRWNGTLAGAECRGMETWVFDEQGLVHEHLMYTHLDVKPLTSPVARLRLLVTSPIAVARWRILH